MALTNLKDMVIEISSRFKQEVEDVISGGLPTHHDNAKFDKPDSGRWARFTILPGEGFQVSLGEPTKRFRHPGVAVVQIFTPQEDGDAEALDVANFIISKFLAQTVNGIVYRTPRIVRVGVSGDDYQMNVEIPFHADFIV